MTKDPKEPEAPEGGEAQAATGDATPETIEIEGKEYPIEEVRSWKEAGLRQADYTKKTMALADEKREWQSKLEQSESRIAQLESSLKGLPKAPEENPYSSLDEYVPDLGKFASEIMKEISQLRSAQEKAETEAADYMRAADAEEALDTALAGFQEKPFANVSEMKSFMESHKLGPDQTDLAYESLYGRKLERAATEADLRKRKADAPAPMSSSRVGIPGSSAEEIAAATSGKPIRDTSWQDLRNRALADPRRSRFKRD